jgi:hypothetical protein
MSVQIVTRRLSEASVDHEFVDAALYASAVGRSPQYAAAE